MNTATVRISDRSRNILRELATNEGASMQIVLERAIETYRRKHFLEEVNRAYAEVHKDKKAWSEVEKERGALDSTLNDGLTPDEDWNEDGEPLKRV